MKRLYWLLAALMILSLVLAACGGTEAPAAEAPAAEEPAEPVSPAPATDGK
ncbi:MAG: ABC transporter substrate-binding protein, partial [Anaerolineales bacterium]|nr:ABC transporter substrate-binding protein [Anaerolineales bacterium]